jgi:hypothetical protein
LRLITLRWICVRPALEILAAFDFDAPLRRKARYTDCLDLYTKPARPPRSETKTVTAPCAPPADGLPPPQPMMRAWHRFR